jgi:hypothetical protein
MRLSLAAGDTDREPVDVRCRSTLLQPCGERRRNDHPRVWRQRSRRMSGSQPLVGDLSILGLDHRLQARMQVVDQASELSPSIPRSKLSSPARSSNRRCAHGRELAWHEAGTWRQSAGQVWR